MSDPDRPADLATKSFFSFPIRRPVATTMFVLAVAVFGFISLGKIPLELLPEISYPTVTVRTSYPGAGPEDVEERISKRIEETLAVLPGLERHSSISRAGVSDVILEFVWGTNLSFATQDIRERLDRTPLPDDAEAPLILRYDPSLDPVIRLSVFGERGLEQIRETAEDVVAKRLQSIPGVAAIKVRGGLESEIRVALDEQKLSNLGLDISEVDRRLKIENVNLASGKLIEGDTEYLVRTLNQFQGLQEILDLAVVEREGQPIRLRDVATVRRTHKDRDVVTRVDGIESVELLVYREADANIVDLAARVRDRLYGSAAAQKLLQDIASGKEPDPEPLLADALRRAELDAADPTKAAAVKEPERGDDARGDGENEEVRKFRAAVATKRAAADTIVNALPRGTGLRLLSDQSRVIRDAIAEVRGSAAIGGLLAVLVLLLFLRSGVATLIIAAAIPVSIVATFAPMFLGGTTLNIMSLGGLALGVGMLVDNSIVVLESIFRCREEGDRREASAIRGAKEVGTAVVASTLTTVAVFFPIVFVEGVAGQLFGDQALTVVFSLISSLIVALFFIPMLSSRGRVREEDLRSLDASQGLTRGGEPRGAIALLKRLATPIVFIGRSLAVRGYREAFQGKTGAARHATVVLLLPLVFLHLVSEIVARVCYVTLAAVVFLIVALVGGILRILAVLGTPVQAAFDGVYGLLARAYPVALRAVLLKPLLLALVLATASIGGYFAWQRLGGLGSEMLPEVHQGEILVHAYRPVGTPVERTSADLLDVEAAILALPDVAQVSAAVGIARDEVADPDEGSHSARILVTIDSAVRDTASASEIAAAEERVIENLRAILRVRPEISGFRFSRPTLFSIRAPLEVEARTEDLETLRLASSELAERMRQLPAVADVRSTVTRGNPEVRLTFDRDRLRRHGLDIEAIANRIRAQVQGVVSTRFSEGDRRIDVRVLADIDTVDRLLNITVNRGRAMDLSDTLDRGREGGGGSSGSGSTRIQDRTLIPGTQVDMGAGAPIPLRQVADIQTVEGPSEIRRSNGQRTAVVTATSRGLDVGAAVSQLQGVLATVEAKYPSVVCTIGGQGAEMGTALDGMRIALLLAVFLVYLVMASQFESVVQPLIILLTIPLALVGAILALDATGTPLSVVALIGAIVLAGIVVNNAIVLVDYTNQLRDRGHSVIDALVEAGRVRLRPILMTTASTVLGLLPLAGALSGLPLQKLLPAAVWRGSELQAPMAIAVIGGLCLSTLLTLFIIPVVYRLVPTRRGGEDDLGDA